ncbi:unnamed protein product, partial [Urochloa humidicola]
RPQVPGLPAPLPRPPHPFVVVVTASAAFPRHHGRQIRGGEGADREGELGRRVVAATVAAASSWSTSAPPTPALAKIPRGRRHGGARVASGGDLATSGAEAEPGPREAGAEAEQWGRHGSCRFWHRPFSGGVGGGRVCFVESSSPSHGPPQIVPPAGTNAALEFPTAVAACCLLSLIKASPASSMPKSDASTGAEPLAWMMPSSCSTKRL